MRSDMDKVLVERPRRGGHGARKGRLPRDPEALPRFLGLRRQAKEHGDFKHLNENLAPLGRYLERQVNRPWNKVYSEICARIDKGNTVQAHVLTHIDQFLHLKVDKVQPSPAAPCGVVLLARRWVGACSVRPGELYVDPDDGIIKRARRKVNATVRRAAPTRQVLAPGSIGVAIGGLWYAVETMPFDIVAEAAPAPLLSFCTARGVSRIWSDPILGVVTAGKAEDTRRLAEVYGRGRLGAGKRQLSGRELRAHGLVNGVRD
jgi:hypothetical protein